MIIFGCAVLEGSGICPLEGQKVGRRNCSLFRRDTRRYGCQVGLGAP